MTVREVPCEWRIVGSDDCDALADSGIGQDAKAAAVAYLWNWTGRRYGLCPVTIRPARVDCPESTYAGGRVTGWTPVLVGGVWRNVTCGTCVGSCGCDDDVTAIRLPGPVDSVETVTIDGDVLDQAAYRVDNHGILVRQDGGRWPRCQDLTEPAGETGTWTVAYTWGVPVPVGGQIAGGLLACEMAKALVGDGDCQLPERVQTITREGVTVGFLDAFDGLDAGRTGIWAVDAWVASVMDRPTPSRVFSPDRRPTARTTYQGPV